MLCVVSPVACWSLFALCSLLFALLISLTLNPWSKRNSKVKSGSCKLQYSTCNSIIRVVVVRLSLLVVVIIVGEHQLIQILFSRNLKSCLGTEGREKSLTVCFVRRRLFYFFITIPNGSSSSQFLRFLKNFGDEKCPGVLDTLENFSFVRKEQ